MASHPPSACCTRGFKHEGIASGEIKKIGDIDTYISHPSNTANSSTKADKAVVIFTDILGLHDNIKFIADNFASRGYLVVVPDLFGGKPLTMNEIASGVNTRDWLKDHTPDVVDPIAAATIKYVRETLGIKRVGAAGYCFGAKYVTRFLKEGGGLDVGYVAHPSFVVAEELLAIKGPYAISAAQTDSVFPSNLRHDTEELLTKVGLPWQITLFSGVEHGFSVRGDLSNKAVRFAKEQAFVQAVTWFREHL
ncbi:dienelactone hydrolase [Histoplasma capsulatum var. duboisii H88]|uniref:Dienelactone hydrolase n=1 Tax=Ajellomyces capsulatus (strain H88) TaxID=544711 RepID=A0A8A1LNV2_AJEC8|nr:dienelactone hydrolase [Histoplasma capsulatum var. duboisii H88]